MKFLATEFRPDGEYAVHIDASNWAEADRICAESGWRLDGEIGAIIPASDTFGRTEADQILADLETSNRTVKQ